MGRLYDVMGIWKDHGTKVTGRPLPGGHNLQEDVPDMVEALEDSAMVGAQGQVGQVGQVSQVGKQSSCPPAYRLTRLPADWRGAASIATASY